MPEPLATPGQTVGPFFHYALPYPQDNQLVGIGTRGAIELHGVVYDGAGQPVSSDIALLEAMLLVEDAWLHALVDAGIAPPSAAHRLIGLLGAADVAAVASAAEPAGNPVVPLVAELRRRPLHPGGVAAPRPDQPRHPRHRVGAHPARRHEEGGGPATSPRCHTVRVGPSP